MLNEKNIKVYSYTEAKNKAETYCAYQERSQQEVRDKLYKLNLHTSQVEELIAYLIENNFLNESRFANAYVSGKFRIKKWGRKKIKQGLKLKGIPEPLIKKAFAQIVEEDYLEVLQELIKKKHAELGFKKDVHTKNKLYNYAFSKGYESNLIFLTLNNNELD